MRFPWNFFSWSLSPVLSLPVPSTTPTSSMSHFKLNWFDWFSPCLPVMFPFLFTPPPEGDPPLRLVDCCWFPWFKLESYPYQNVLLGVSYDVIIFILVVQTLFDDLEFLLLDDNFSITNLHSLNLLVFFTSQVHYIWFRCYLCASFLN